MKNILVIVFVISNIGLFGQNKRSKVDDFFTSIKKYTRNLVVNSVQINSEKMTLKDKQRLRVPTASSEVNKKVERMNENEVMIIARKINEAVTENPIYFKKRMTLDVIEVENKIKQGRNDLLEATIFTTILKNKLKKLGKTKIAKFLTIPLFLRVKINSIVHESKKFTNQISFSVPKTVFKCTVTGIVKGNSLFKTGDLLEFYYMNFWKNTKRTFSEGKEYCVPLTIRLDSDEDGIPNEDGGYSLALVTNTKTDGIYAIRDNKVIDETNYFGLGVKTDWTIFKTEFSKKYMKF